MKLLLDTHFLIWLIEAPNRLTRREQQLLQRAERSTFISSVSLWEIRIKWDSRDRYGRRKGTVNPVAALAFAEQGSMIVAPLTAKTAIAELQTPVEHADPFDKMMLVHAQQLGAKLLTRDEKLLVHPLAYSL